MTIVKYRGTYPANSDYFLPSFSICDQERNGHDGIQESGSSLFGIGGVHGAESYGNSEMPEDYGVVLFHFHEGYILDNFISVLGIVAVPGDACFFQLYAGIVCVLLQFYGELFVVGHV